ncbi:unnamed protein product [Moneuplotes crassus]|uniref:Uncharacterized protein n=1 Tax=Euplotes crassus TaxID=5936 RepID=A0AAD1XW47_EUPCR|nr:unnamed protein product [Moneuplotes crassus]
MPANPFADKINGDDSNSDTEAQNIKISDYNDIFKQVEKDLGVKYSGNGSSEEITNSSQTREKISFPLVPGQAVATLEELVVDLEKARSSKNHKLIVSLCSTCSKKVTDPGEKVRYLSEKFRSLEALDLPKLCEETANEILKYEPQNVQFKFYQTKLLIKNSKNIWDSQIEYLRARCLIEKELARYPEDYDLNKFLGELEQIYYSLKIKIEQKKVSSKSYMQIGGSNINCTVGIGTDESTKEKYITLDELYSKKISSIATGDFHTLIICENLGEKDGNDKINTNVGDTDIIAFGLNQHGQVNSVPSEESVKTPKIVPFFIGKKPQLVSACRSRSVALVDNGKVYEWGFLGSEKKQFNILYDFYSEDSILDSEDEIIDIKCGLEYTLFLSKEGKVYIIGTISQMGEFVFESGELISLNEEFCKSGILDYAPSFAKDFIKSQMKERGEEEENKQILIRKMDAGYSHCMFLDSQGIVYVFGAGHFGQLGLGFDDIKAKRPAILEELNDGLDKIVNISCGANCCVAYTELGLLYSWGMLNDGDPDTINYFPTILGVPENTTLSHINAQSREIMACDVHGDLYHCDLEFRRRLENVDKDKFLDKNNRDFFIRKVFCGRSMRILLDSLLSPEKSIVCQKVETMETLIENEIIIELSDILSEPFSISSEQKFEIFSKIRILFTQSKSFNLSNFKISEYNPEKKEEPKKPKFKRKIPREDDEEEEKIITTKAAKTTTNFNTKKKKPVGGTKAKKPKAPVKPGKPKTSKVAKRPETTKAREKPKVQKDDTVEEEKLEDPIDVKEELLFLQGSVNIVKFKTYYEIDNEFPSKISLKILPQNGDEYENVYCRIFVDSIEVKKSNFQLQIVKSQLHLDLEAENERLRERELKIQEQRRLDKLKELEEKERKRKEKEEERLRQQKLKEEAAKRRKEETMKRAQEALIKAKEAREKELQLKEEERKMRKEMRTGGGFNMALHRAKLEEAKKEEP